MQSITPKAHPGRALRHAATKIALVMGVVAISAAWTGREMVVPPADLETVEVVLRGDQIQAPDSVAAGAVDFRVRNMGEEPLGFVVQDAQGQAAVQIQEVAPQDAKTGQARLTPGTYRLLAVDAQGQPTNARNLRVF